MEESDYFKKAKEIENIINHTKFSDLESLGLLGTYMMLSSNLLKYLPKIELENHFEIIKKIQYYRAISNLDQYYLNLQDKLKIVNGNLLNYTSTKGCIFVTYHTGSYRLFIQHLMCQNVPFSLVTEKKFIVEQNQIVQSIYRNIRKDEKAKLDILEAENPKLLLELRRRLLDGISIVFYIDGNTGTKTSKNEINHNLIKIKFLQSYLWARKGISYLAYITDAPLITALSRKNKKLKNEIYLNEIEYRHLKKEKKRDEFNLLMTRRIYKKLNDFLYKNPEQWEGWFYVDKFFLKEKNFSKNKIKIKAGESYKILLNDYVFLLKYNNEKYFTINRKKFEVNYISKELFEVLNFFKNKKIIVFSTKTLSNKEGLKMKFVQELLDYDYLKIRKF
jgi:KDO2-lipid IV(A) lauroyltransferase